MYDFQFYFGLEIIFVYQFQSIPVACTIQFHIKLMTANAQIRDIRYKLYVIAIDNRIITVVVAAAYLVCNATHSK